MKITIDMRPVCGRMHGIARYALRLARHMIDAAPEHRFVLIAALRGNLDILPRAENARTQLVDIPLYRLSEQWRLAKLLREEKPDVHFSPTFSAPAMSPCPFVFTIHDLIHLRFPRDYGLAHRVYYRTIVRTAARRARFVLTDSECSRRDLIALLAVRPDKINVVPVAPDPVFAPGDAAEARERVAHIIPDAPFILWVGSEKAHKNFAGAVEVVRELQRMGTPAPLVGVGVSERHARGVGLNGVDFTAAVNVSDEQLCALYRSARALLCTSLYEGFGLTPLEAFACGTPAVVFDNSSLSELLAPTGALVPSGDAKSAARRLAELLSNDAENRKAADAGAARAGEFCWPDISGRVLALLEEAAGVGSAQ